jgi:SEC-C motif-containing protein
MRSRYSGYALGLVDFIITTTHPKNPSFSLPLDEWKAQIRAFSTSTSFDGLVIHEFVDGADTASVTFTVILRQQANDISFTEKSEFEKGGDQWLYKEGTITSYTRRTA